MGESDPSGGVSRVSKWRARSFLLTAAVVSWELGRRKKGARIWWGLVPIWCVFLWCCSNGAAISPVGVDLLGGVFVLLVGM